jgi:hypothetical protein
VGKLISNDGKPFSQLRKAAKDLVTATQNAYTAASENLAAEKALATRQNNKSAKKLQAIKNTKTQSADSKPGEGWGNGGQRHHGKNCCAELRPEDPHRSCCSACGHRQVNFELSDEAYDKKVAAKKKSTR